jgi:hypothetical protein
MYRFLTGLTPMSIINRYQTEIYLDLTPIYTIIRYETNINTDFMIHTDIRISFTPIYISALVLHKGSTISVSKDFY